MKLLRIAGLIVFLLSSLSYGSYKFYENNYVDYMGPEITCQSDSITVSVKATEEELLQGVKAYDQEDGDVTKSIMIEKISKLTDSDTRTITYAAFDSSNNVTKFERELIYADYTPPRFSLSKPLNFIIGEQDDIIQYMQVTDSIDGDLSDKIRYEEPDYFFGQSEGSYEIKFQVTNSAGVSVVLPAEVEFHYPSYESSNKIPEIILSEYLIYLKAGDSYDAKSYLQKVKIGNKEYSITDNQLGVSNSNTISKNRISVQSKVNTREPGVYEVDFSMTTDDGYTGTTKLLVVVEE